MARVPKLVIGANSALMSIANRSPRSLSRDVVPAIPAVTVDQLPDGLGLNASQRSALEDAASRWMLAKSEAEFRKRCLADIRGLLPDHVHRQLVLTKAIGLWERTLRKGFGSGDKPPAGFSPIPNSRKGGFRKQSGGGFIYWYPGVGVTRKPAEEGGPKPKFKQPKKPGSKQKEKSDQGGKEKVAGVAEVAAVDHGAVTQAIEGKEGHKKLRALMAEMVRQHGKEAVASAAHEVAGSMAEVADHELQTRAGNLDSHEAVQRVTKEHVGEGKRAKGWQSPKKVAELARALHNDAEVRHAAEKEIRQVIPKVIEAGADAAVSAVDAGKQQPSKLRAIARLILKSAAGSFAFGFIDNFMLYVAGASVDKHLAVMGFGAAAVAGVGNAISDAVGEAGSGIVEKALDKLGLGEEQADEKVLSEKTQKRIKAASRIGGVFVGALCGMVPLLFGVKFGKSVRSQPFRRGTGPYLTLYPTSVPQRFPHVDNLLKADPVKGQMGLFDKPKTGGWEPIPGGKRGGQRRRVGNDWQYRYPEERQSRIRARNAGRVRAVRRELELGALASSKRQEHQASGYEAHGGAMNPHMPADVCVAYAEAAEAHYAANRFYNIVRSAIAGRDLDSAEKMATRAKGASKRAGSLTKRAEDMEAQARAKRIKTDSDHFRAKIALGDAVHSRDTDAAADAIIGIEEHKLQLDSVTVAQQYGESVAISRGKGVESLVQLVKDRGFGQYFVPYRKAVRAHQMAESELRKIQAKETFETDRHYEHNPAASQEFILANEKERSAFRTRRIMQERLHAYVAGVTRNEPMTEDQKGHGATVNIIMAEAENEAYRKRSRITSRTGGKSKKFHPIKPKLIIKGMPTLVAMLQEPLSKGGPYIGPKGGKWDDPQHTIPYKEDKPKGLKWSKTPEGEYTARGGEIKIQRAGGKKWELVYHGETHPFTVRKPSFDHADALVQKLDAKGSGEKPALQRFKDDQEKKKARQAAIRKQIAIGGEYEIGEGRYLLVMPDPAAPGKVRTQSFDEQGFSGHHTYKDLDKLKDAIATEHHQHFKPASGTLEKLSRTDKWAEGMARTHVVMALNSLGYYGQSKDVERINQHVDKHGFKSAAEALSGWSEDQKQLSDITRKRLAKSILWKGAGHKYLKRVPRGNPPPRWRYVYQHPKRKGLTTSDDLHTGAKIKVAHEGKEGHLEVIEHQKDRGIVRMRHDESGKTIHVRESDLHRMVTSHHKKKAKATADSEKQEFLPYKMRSKEKQEEIPGTKAPPKAKRGKVTRITMDALPDWDEVIGFARSEGEAQILAGGTKREVAIVEQPGGFVVAARDRRKSKTGEAQGDQTVVMMRDKSGKGIAELESEYVVMEADAVIASHDPLTMQPREDYPEGVQEREYHELTGEKMKVARIGRETKPRMVANTNPDAVNGPPIVTQDGIVLGGNGRTMGMQLAYSKHPEAASALKTFLAQHAKEFGLRASEVEGIKQPILVRRVKVGKDPKKLLALGRRMNEALTQGMDPRAMEVALGKNYVDRNLTGALVARMDMDQTLNDFLGSAASKPFMDALEASGIIDERNREEFTDEKTGLLNEDGRLRVERVIAARMLPDAAILRSMNQSTRTNLAGSVPYLLRAESAGWDLRESLMTAVKADINYRSQRKYGTPAQYMKQVVNEKLDPDHPGLALQQDEMARHLFEVLHRFNGPRKMAAGFRDFARRAETAKHVSAVAGGGLFGEQAETASEALDRAFGIGKESAAAKKAAKEAAKAEEAKLAAEMGIKPKRRKAKEQPAESQEQLLRAVESEPISGQTGSVLMSMIAREVNHHLHGQLQASAIGDDGFHVDGDRIKRAVMDMILYALQTDDRVARAIGETPIDGKVIDGLIAAGSEIWAPKLNKAIIWWRTPKQFLGEQWN